MTGTPPLLIVDGHHLLYRAWFGFPARINNRAKTRDLTGVFGFLALLRKAHLAHAGDHEIVVVFDGENGTTSRTDADGEYKANRASADHSPIASLADVKHGLDTCSVGWLEIDDAEGDDTIATLTANANAAGDGRTVTIMSGDRDLHQLLDRPCVRILNTAAHPERRIITAERVNDRYGVRPRQWPDYRALTGDPADNIAGIPGIGPKTAARLLHDGLTLDDLPASGRLIGATGARVIERWDDVRRWRDLIRLDAKITIPYDPVRRKATPPLPPAAVILESLHLW